MYSEMNTSDGVAADAAGAIASEPRTTTATDAAAVIRRRDNRGNTPITASSDNAYPPTLLPTVCRRMATHARTYECVTTAGRRGGFAGPPTGLR